MTPAWSFEKCHICSVMCAEQLWGVAEQSPKGSLAEAPEGSQRSFLQQATRSCCSSTATRGEHQTEGKNTPNRVWEMGKKPQLHLNSSLNPHLAIRGTKTFDLDLPHLSASLFVQRKVLLRFSNRVKGNFLQRSPQTRSASDFL